MLLGESTPQVTPATAGRRFSARDGPSSAVPATLATPGGSRSPCRPRLRNPLPLHSSPQRDGSGLVPSAGTKRARFADLSAVSCPRRPATRPCPAAVPTLASPSPQVPGTPFRVLRSSHRRRPAERSVAGAMVDEALLASTSSQRAQRRDGNAVDGDEVSGVTSSRHRKRATSWRTARRSTRACGRRAARPPQQPRRGSAVPDDDHAQIGKESHPRLSSVGSRPHPGDGAAAGAPPRKSHSSK